MEQEVENHDIFQLDKVSNLKMHSAISHASEPKPKSDVPLSFEAQLEAERSDWSLKIRHISEKIKHMKDLRDLQYDVFTSRTDALERKHSYMSMRAKIEQKIKKQKMEKLEHFSTRYDRKLNATEKDVLIDGSISDIAEHSEYISAQIEFFQETIKTIDNITYGIKIRVEINEYQKVI
jgi:hypothetical protein